MSVATSLTAAFELRPFDDQANAASLAGASPSLATLSPSPSRSPVPMPTTCFDQPVSSLSLAPSPIIPHSPFFGDGFATSHEHGRHRSSLDGLTSPNIAAPAKRLSKVIFAEQDEVLRARASNSSQHLWSRLPSPSPSPSRLTFHESSSSAPDSASHLSSGVAPRGSTTNSVGAVADVGLGVGFDLDAEGLGISSREVADENVEEGTPSKSKQLRRVSPDRARRSARPPASTPLPQTSYIPPLPILYPSTPSRSSAFDVLMSWFVSPSASSTGSPTSDQASPLSSITPTRHRYHVFPISPSLLRPHPRSIHGGLASKSVYGRSSSRFLFLACVAASLLLVWRRSTLNAELGGPRSMTVNNFFEPIAPRQSVLRARPFRPTKASQGLDGNGRLLGHIAMTDGVTFSPADEKRLSTGKYKNLLPLNKAPRRHIYGANLQGSCQGDLNEDNHRRSRLPTEAELQSRFKSDQRRFEQERPGWQGFEWKAPGIDATLRRFERGLSSDEQSLREWIRRLHRGVEASAVGVTKNSTTKPMSTTWPDSLPNLGPMPYLPRDLGSIRKWELLEMQALSPGDGGMCAGSTWLDDYAKMHREILEGEREPRFVSYHCESGMNCGGAADRLLGLTSAFFFGLVTDRAFIAEWQNPVPLEVVFDSPRIDWSHSSFTADSDPVLGDPELAFKARDLDIVHFDRLAMDTTFGSKTWYWQEHRHSQELQRGFEQRDLAFQSPWIKMYTNRGMILRSFHYAHLRSRLERLGLQPLTAFGCISNYLFKPKPAALDLITSYTSVFALPSVFSVGIQIRTGDESMKSAEYDERNTVQRHSDFFRCARELATTYSLPSQRILYYLVTDSAHLKLDAQRELGDSLVLTEMKPQHVHVASSHHAVDGVMGAVVENWILGKTDMRVATQDSGFGKLAAFASGNNVSTVTLQASHRLNKAKGKKKGRFDVDCTRPEALIGFDELSSTWSLG